jgi:group I intron endonuclease
LVTNAIRRDGSFAFKLTILVTGLLESQAKELEKNLIKINKTNICRHGWSSGYNRTDGGEGTRGHKHSEKQKQKWSKERKGKPSWSLGKKFSPEHKANISKAKKGSVPPNKGKKAKPSTLEKMSLARKGRPQPGISKAKKGKSNGHEGLPSSLKGRLTDQTMFVIQNLPTIEMLIALGAKRKDICEILQTNSLDRLLRTWRLIKNIQTVFSLSLLRYNQPS